MTTHMVLSGIIIKTPIREVSPSGITHWQFYLEHRSEQDEVGLKRQVQCYLPVVVSGHNESNNRIKKGNKVCISGFIATQQRQNKMAQVILHANHIEFLGE